MDEMKITSKVEHFAHKKKNSKSRKKIISFFFILLIILGFVLFTYKKNKEAERLDQLSQSASELTTEDQVQSVLASVSKLTILPDEAPVLFIISDVDLLKKEQLFFNNAQNGDILLVFPQAVKALIYSPSRNLIVNMGPVSFGQESTIPQEEAIQEGVGVSDSVTSTSAVIEN